MRWTMQGLSVLALATATCGYGQAAVRVEPPNPVGTHALRAQTAAAAVRDYLEAWGSLRTALRENRASALEGYFVGSTKDKLAATIDQQRALAMTTNYNDTAHDVQVVFYSPEGLSLELKDTVDYEIGIYDHDKLRATQHQRANYLVVMTPTETRWCVRIFQAEPE